MARALAPNASELTDGIQSGGQKVHPNKQTKRRWGVPGEKKTNGRLWRWISLGYEHQQISTKTRIPYAQQLSLMIVGVADSSWETENERKYFFKKGVDIRKIWKKRHRRT